MKNWNYIDGAKGVMTGNAWNDYSVRWTEFNSRDQLVTKQKDFPTEDAMTKFIEKLSEKDNFNQVVATSSPTKNSKTGNRASYKPGDEVTVRLPGKGPARALVVRDEGNVIKVAFSEDGPEITALPSEVSNAKTGNETMHEWATSKPKNVGMRTLGTLATFKSLPMDIRKEVFRKLGDSSEATIDYGPNKYWFDKNTLKKEYAKEIEEEEKKVGNAKVINSDREFFKELADDAKEREDKDKQEVEKLVENRLDWSENLVGKEVWVKSKGDEWKCYVMQDKGDKVYIRHDADGSQGWVSKERITGKVSNSKVGNVASEYEILKHDPSKMHPMYKKAYEEAMKKLAREDEEFKKRFEKEYGVKAKNEASDDKFAYVMREFDEGKLKTPDGKVVTDPAQAKAIAYSESKKTENGLARARNAIKK